MAPSKASNDIDEESHFPNISKAAEAPPKPNYILLNQASRDSTTPSPKLPTVGSSRSPLATKEAPPFDHEAALAGSARLASRTREELDEYFEPHGDATPTGSMKPGSNLRNTWVPGFDDDHDDHEAAPTGPAKLGNNFRNPYSNNDREDGSNEPFNPGDRPHDQFEAISVHTAKCDGCGKHNNKVVQRCKRCNLQYCKPCLQGRTDGQDGRHFADVDNMDWVPKPMIRSKRTNEETKKKKATSKAAASKGPKQAPRAPTRPPSERVQIAEARRRSTAPPEDDMTINVEVPRRRQHFDDFEYNEGPSRRPKRHYGDNDDEDRPPKKSRGGRAVEPKYTYDDEYSEDEAPEDLAAARARYNLDRRRPVDPYEGRDNERSGSRQGTGRGTPGGFGSAAGPYHGAHGYQAPVPRRPTSQTGRAPMSHAEAIAAALEQRQARQHEREYEQLMEAAQANPQLKQMMEEGRHEEVKELLEVAATLRGMRGNME